RHLSCPSLRPSSLSSVFPPARPPPHLPSFPTRRSSDLHQAAAAGRRGRWLCLRRCESRTAAADRRGTSRARTDRLRRQFLGQPRSEEHTSELQSHLNLVCRLLLEKKKIR